jgi:hypothetical protein
MSAGAHLDEITHPGRPELHEVADGVFAYVQPTAPGGSTTPAS